MRMGHFSIYSCALILGTGLFTFRAEAQLHTFFPPVSVSSPIYGIGAAVDDVNSDGVRDLVISERGDQSAPGTVYLYSGADYSILNSYTSPNAEANGQFGAIMQPVHNVGGSARGDLLVGAPGETVSSNSGAGRAYLVDAADGTVYGTLVSPSPQTMGLFGATGTSIGDLNGDTIPDLIVSAVGEGASGEGRAYIFSGAAGFALIDALNSPNPVSVGSFGGPVATGDLNGDTVDDFAIQAPQEKVNALTFAGRVYVYSGATRTVLYTLESPTPANSGLFGQAVAAIGDVDNDGKPDWVVGCNEHINTYASGKAYVFSGGDGHLIRTLTPDLPSDYWSTSYGISATGLQDITGDGIPDFAIGEKQGNGQVDFYSGADGSQIATLHSTIYSTSGSQGFMFPRSIPDIDGDGKNDLLVSDLVASYCYLYGSKPQIKVSPAGVTFGFRPAQSGMSQPTTVQIQNNGFTPLTFNTPALAITGPNAGEFAITSQPSSATVPFGGGPVNIGVAFNPLTEGTKTATLQIFSDNPTSPTVNVPLAGATKPPLETGPTVAYVANGGSVYVIDLATGNRDRLTGPDTGSGTLDTMVMGIDVRNPQNLLVVGSQLYNVSRFAGDRTLVSGTSAGSGPIFNITSGLAVENSGAVLVASTYGYIVRTDPVTGDRSYLSGASYGSGPAFSTYNGPMDIALESDGTIVVPDNFSNSVFRIDPGTGNRTVLSTAVQGPYAVAPLSNGNLVVVAHTGTTYGPTGSGLAEPLPTINSIYEVAVADGTAQLRSGGSPAVGTGPDFVDVEAVSVAPNGTVYVYDQGLDALISVDMTTGYRTVVSSANPSYPVGTGPALGGTYPPGSPYPDLVVTTAPVLSGVKDWPLYR